ncbi:hypothetical protein ACW2QC_17200 [Virgibacillus sp. FSP13]
MSVLQNLVIRKLLTTFIVTTLTSIIMAFLFVITYHSEPTYNLGNTLMGWSFVYMMYVGVIIMLYGNVVSIALEFLRTRWLNRRQNWLFVILHAVFGLVVGLIFLNWLLSVSGMLVAIGYAIVDRWIYTRQKKQKGVKMFIITPVLIYCLSWGVLQILSPSMPPFTKEDAVEFATSGQGTVIDRFPEKIGKLKEKIDGYNIERETTAKKVGDEKYIVTFTETWKKENDIGSRYYSYEVERNSMTAHQIEGKEPPY